MSGFSNDSTRQSAGSRSFADELAASQGGGRTQGESDRPGKRVLIADDSRSARVILGRLIQTFGLQVEFAESAEQAIEQARTMHPDAIFMDHLMPGMDGLQAVRALKADARTRSIPVVMYTAQNEGQNEGSYLRQALASGAIGVISKNISPQQVSAMLYQLQLLPDRRVLPDEAPTRPPPNVQAAKVNSPREMMATSPATQAESMRATGMGNDDLRSTLRQELQRFAINSRANADANAATAKREHAVEVSDERKDDAGDHRSSNSSSRFVSNVGNALLATTIAVVIGVGFFLWQQLVRIDAQLAAATRQLQQLTQQQHDSQTPSVDLPTNTDASSTAVLAAPTAAGVALAAPVAQSVSVPFGERPFAGGRVQWVQARLTALRSEGFTGVAQFTFFVGDFCLAGNSLTGFAPASADLSVRRCDMIGNPFLDGLPETQRQSEDFVVMLQGFPRDARHPLQVNIEFGGHQPAVAYPTQTNELRAGEWNIAASRNNRIELTLNPATAPAATTNSSAR